MRIIGYHISNTGIIANSEGNAVPFFRDPLACLDFLLEPIEDSIKVFYHLNYSVANLCRWLGLLPGQCEELHDKGQCSVLVETGKGVVNFVFKYAPAKFFSLKAGRRYGSPFYNFSDMSQYTECALEGDEDTRTCVQKAIEAQRVGERVYKFATSLNLSPTTLTSPIRMFEKEILGRFDEKGKLKPKGVDIPTVADLPANMDKEIAHYASMCCKGPWNEAFKKGHFKDTIDLDINSAYPYYLSQLLDTRYGDWSYVKKYTPTADYSFYKVYGDMEASFHPILYKVSDDMSYTPNGEWPDYLLGEQIEFIRRWKLGDAEIVDGYAWHMKEKHRPLQTVIQWLWNVKEKNEGLERGWAKRTANGIWGKLGEERRGEIGLQYFSPWHAWVEVMTQLQVAELVLSNKLEQDILSIAVDGALIDMSRQVNGFLVSSLTDDLLHSRAMGAWRLSSRGPALVISTGTVAVKDKIGVGDFALDYDKLMDMISDKPEAEEYYMHQEVPMTLGRALNEDRLLELGNMIEITKTINIQTAEKRKYPVSPTCGKDLLDNTYDSQPIHASMLQLIGSKASG